MPRPDPASVRHDLMVAIAEVTGESNMLNLHPAMGDAIQAAAEHIAHRYAEPEPGAGPLLTEAEHDVMQRTADLWGALCGITGRTGTRDADLTEVVAHVHAIQYAVLSQAAARAYPGLYRLLGESLRKPPSKPPKIIV